MAKFLTITSRFLLMAALAALIVTPVLAHPTIDVAASNWKFTPATITVNAGEPTTLRLTSTSGAHGIASDELGISNTTIQPGRFVEVSFTPKTPGTYAVHCSLFCGAGHPDMVLTIVVTGAAAAPTVAPAAATSTPAPAATAIPTAKPTPPLIDDRHFIIMVVNKTGWVVTQRLASELEARRVRVLEQTESSKVWHCHRAPAALVQGMVRSTVPAMALDGQADDESSASYLTDAPDFDAHFWRSRRHSTTYAGSSAWRRTD
jgi:plastocyanin